MTRAREALVESSLGLIYNIVQQVETGYDAGSAGFLPGGATGTASGLSRTGIGTNGRVEGTIVDVEDLRQEGAEAFAQAIETYDSTRGVCLNSYAGQAVRNRVYKVLEQSRYIPHNRGSYRSFSGEYVAERDAARLELGREPTEEELAHRMDRNVRWVRAVARELAIGSTFASLDAQTGPEAPGCYSAEDEFLAADEEAGREELLDELRRALVDLSDDDRRLLAALFDLEDCPGGTVPKTSATELARRLGVGRRCLYRMRTYVLDDLRHRLEDSDGDRSGVSSLVPEPAEARENARELARL